MYGKKILLGIAIMVVLSIAMTGCATHNPPPCDEFASAGQVGCGAKVPINVAWK